MSLINLVLEISEIALNQRISTKTISVMNNSVMFRVKKGLALSKNIEEPWGFKYRLEKKQRG